MSMVFKVTMGDMFFQMITKWNLMTSSWS